MLLRSQAASVKERLRRYFICQLFPALSHCSIAYLPQPCVVQIKFFWIFISMFSVYILTVLLYRKIKKGTYRDPFHNSVTDCSSARPLPVPQNKIKCNQRTTLKPKCIINISISVRKSYSGRKLTYHHVV